MTNTPPDGIPPEDSLPPDPASQDPASQDSTSSSSPASSTSLEGADKKVAAGICGILLGAFGVHKFILGYTTEGGIMLGVTIAAFVLSCCTAGLSAIAPAIMSVIGLVEGIIYLTKTDEDFVNTYIQNQKGWF